MALSSWLRLVEAALRVRGVRRRAAELGDGRRVSYLEAGPRDAAKTFVLLHGLGSSNMTWVRVLPRLKRRHRVVAVDLPGYGRTPLPDGRAFEGLAGLARAVVAALESDVVPQRAILVGQSMGGWVAVKAARQAPQKVEHLVLVNTAGVLYDGIEELRTLLAPTTREDVHALWRKIWFRVPFYYRPFWKDAAAHLQSANVRGLMESVQQADFVHEDLPRLEMPVTVVWGRADGLLPASTVDALVRELGSARVHWVARCGHIPPLERPREFLRILDAVAVGAPEATPAPPTVAHRTAPVAP